MEEQSLIFLYPYPVGNRTHSPAKEGTSSRTWTQITQKPGYIVLSLFQVLLNLQKEQGSGVELTKSCGKICQSQPLKDNILTPHTEGNHSQEETRYSVSPRKDGRYILSDLILHEGHISDELENFRLFSSDLQGSFLAHIPECPNLVGRY